MIASALESPNEVAERLTGRDYLSWSAVSTYQQCPLRYRFKYVDGLPEETVSSSLIFGGALHAAAEHHYRERLAGNPPPNRSVLLDVFWCHWHDRSESQIQFARGEDHAALGELAERSLKLFQHSGLAEPPGRIVGVEEQLQAPLIPGCPDLRVWLDLLYLTDDALVVCDLKTSRSRWSAAQVEQASGQLLLYGELARSLAPDRDVRLEFAVITKTKTPCVERHEVDAGEQQVAQMQKVVEQVWRAIESESFYPTPSPLACASCPFQEPCRKWR